MAGSRTGTTGATGRAGGQASLDDLGTPLHDVTFCVLDIETTGGRADDGGITEVGAVRLRGGECLGTFQTLVNPGLPIPPQITVLTGITDAMVVPAPRLGPVLAAFVEFVGDAVIVGHNVRYDMGFLNAALEHHDRPRFANRVVDTCALARRLVRDEVPNCRLGTLASRLRLPHQPSHRALDDALATGDLLHVLLERASGLGVLGLDDLLALPTMAGHPQAAKLRLTEHLPRAPGVYRFRDRGGRVLYVGKATDLRSRVRSYFSGDERRKVGQLLRETEAVDAVVCSSTLEAAVLELRLIRALDPRFNRQGRARGGQAWIRLTDEQFPRLSVVRTVKGPPADHLGPFPTHRAAARVVEALQSALPLRRCQGRPGSREAPCAPAQLGRALCPCAGDLDAEVYARVVDAVRTGWQRRPDLLLSPLAEQMDRLARDERFEEAADVRDRAGAVVATLRRRRRVDALRASGRTELALPGGAGAVLEGGVLTAAWGPDGQVRSLDLVAGVPPPADDGPDAPPSAALTAEVLCVAGWLDRAAGRVRVVESTGGLRSPWPALPDFAARRPRPTAVPATPPPDRSRPARPVAGRSGVATRRPALTTAGRRR
ncbi:DEDD exonuclease domain-containing protein [Iamia majanohamensis]|uniref:DEDD exonuclease domain-containing protein n=1 Tax=Iamia majanohamensis TaxID=467976 RepID=A0AAF0BQY8_9ACTN|nr:DEDD exonuclease domain-containing protein [Iamia majanohamensis]WCO65646.1 DEDD exonuclease domain-containing protein [Iamia majanohamensis]